MLCSKRRHIADLVQKDRAAGALLELADAAAVGSGEGALLVPEQLALQQRLGNGRAVDRQEAPGCPRAVLIDGPRDQLLAGAALAADQHGDVLRGDAADCFVDLLHRFAAADHHVGVAAGPRPARIHRHGHVHGPPDLKGLPDQLAHLGKVERLEQVVEGAALHGLDGRLAVAAGRDEDHRQRSVVALNAVEDVEPFRIGQHDVQKHRVDLMPGQHLHGVRSSGSRVQDGIGLVEDLAKNLKDGGIIVDNQK